MIADYQLCLNRHSRLSSYAESSMEPFEPPKYLKDLIAAINDGAKSAQLGALAFTAIGVFLLATAFSATDEDLLLNRALTISQLGGTAVPVVFAFGLAPAVFVAAHFYTLIRYDMLAGNVRRFREDLAVMVRSEADRDRCRQLLANVEFVSALAMPRGSRASSWMFSWTVRALLAVFPVSVLLLVQLQSLRLQSGWGTWTHHASIAADLVLLVWFFGRLRGDDGWHFWKAPFRRKVALFWMPAVVLLADLAWLQVPWATATTVGADRNLKAYWHDYPGVSAPIVRQVDWLFAFNPVDLLLCTPGAWGCRYLTVANRILVTRILDTTTFVALRAGAEADEKHRAAFEAVSLRGRTLRFANLTASELFAADLTGADLQQANLLGATLKAAALFQAELQGANLVAARLQGANLNQAQLQGSYLSAAQLQGASLVGAQLQGASLDVAQLQGADLAEAQLQGASLSETQLEGANLGRAQLQGADLRWAELQGADLRVAGLWNVRGRDIGLGLADLRAANFDEVSAGDILAKLSATTPDKAKQQIRRRLTPTVGAQTLLDGIDTAAGKILVTNPDDATWRNLDRATQLTAEPADIDPALAKLLADIVAPLNQSAAAFVASRVIYPSDEDKQRPLVKLLSCHLQEQVDAKRVTLDADWTEQLRKATRPCRQTSQ
jgi:uncharacterized protein YjbI with pentapeptide repeats